MIVIGVDAHKRTHTLVALDAVTGVAKGELTVQATDDGALNALRFAGGVDQDRVWAHEIRVLCDYRDQLMHERNRLISRLRWLLVRIAPQVEAQIGPAALNGPRIRARLARQLGQLPASTELRVAKAQLRRINQIEKEQKELFAELTDLLQQHAPQLLAQPRIGTVTAAVIIGRTAGAARFRSEACFARHCGTAPIPASSGNTKRYRLHRGGDRQLNRAIHIIALGRMAGDPETRAYIERRVSGGKTKLEAIRCLKRHIARQIWRLLYNAQPITAAPIPADRTRVSVTAPSLMPCTR
jgi:transposase